MQREISAGREADQEKKREAHGLPFIIFPALLLSSRQFQISSNPSSVVSAFHLLYLFKIAIGVNEIQRRIERISVSVLQHF